MKTSKKQVQLILPKFPNENEIEKIVYSKMVIDGIQQAEEEIGRGEIITQKDLKKISKKW